MSKYLLCYKVPFYPARAAGFLTCAGAGCLFRAHIHHTVRVPAFFSAPSCHSRRSSSGPEPAAWQNTPFTPPAALAPLTPPAHPTPNYTPPPAEITTTVQRPQMMSQLSPSLSALTACHRPGKNRREKAGVWGGKGGVAPDRQQQIQQSPLLAFPLSFPLNYGGHLRSRSPSSRREV